MKIHKKRILVYLIGCVTVKNLRYKTINSVNLLYLTINKVNGYIEESIGNDNLVLVSTYESVDTIKKDKEQISYSLDQ